MNNTDGIILYLFTNKPSPLYDPVFDNQYGAITPLQHKMVTIKMLPQFDINTINAPYEIIIIIA